MSTPEARRQQPTRAGDDAVEQFCQQEADDIDEIDETDEIDGFDTSDADG